MQLSSFQKNKKKKQSVILISIGLVLLVAGIILYRTYSLFEEKGEYDVIKGSVPEYIDNYDVKVALTVDGVSQNNFPTKTDGKWPESVTCDKGATGYWDYENWALNVDDLSETRTKCIVHFVSKYFELELNGADPVLKDGMIPVIIENNGVVKKADLEEKWYEYNNKEWANVVLLTNPSKADSIHDGDMIAEGDIESYFVWIPRFRYQIFNEGKYEGQVSSVSNIAKEINVKFENKNKSISDGSTVGSWLTHPAFTAFDVNGMWVGKFETGYKGAATKEAAEKNVNEPTSIQIKPNVYSWRGIQVSNAYYSSLNYKQEYNSHMMKNTEWGAVAYLQHSKYGSQTSVRINNNASFLTGYASVFEPSCGYTGTNESCNKYESTLPKADGTYTVNYLNPTSQVASTTNNYSGVYDMSGGAWEYVMGVIVGRDGVTPCSGRAATANSGFNGSYCNVGQTGSKTDGVPFPIDSRYYDIYAYAEVDERYDRRILGDGTGEMGPFATKTYGSQQRQVGSWYDDEAWFVDSWASWFYRSHGMNSGSGAGVFAFGSAHGSGDEPGSFRVVLSV